MTVPAASGLRVRALAKINVTLEVLGTRADGYHDVRTVLQSIDLHDTLVFRLVPGPFRLSVDDPSCPADRSNLVWRAAERLWEARHRRGPLAGVHAHIRKRIPMQAGLGGGSADAAATMRALAVLWKMAETPARLHALAGQLGADVPFFLQGGTMLGLDRGDRLYPLVDRPPSWVVLVRPPFGVSTADAYRWWDARGGRSDLPDMFDADEVSNDLQGPVAAHHPAVGQLAKRLRVLGARAASMSGSGSAVFGLFSHEQKARSAARALEGGQRLVLVTRTLTRRSHSTRTRPY